MSGVWRIWIDRGGTFTDCLGLNPADGRVHVAKVLSSDRAPLVGIRKLLGLGEGATIPPCEIRMGTTIATNALLERTGEPTALLVTRGFSDLLEIGTQARPDIFAFEIQKPELLYREVHAVDARCAPDGTILSRPDAAVLRDTLKHIHARGIRSLAIVFIHAYVNPTLEIEAAAAAVELGFTHVSTSHEVAREIGMLGRGDTTTVDAYLTPLIRRYVKELLDELPGSTLRIMQSSGGLTDALSFSGKNAILSGPAGGVVAYARVAEAAGYDRAIGFDMGGTSTDVSRYAGELEHVYETEIAGVRLRAPMMAIHTVAAGGGSLCRYDGYRFTVGPESAGSDPGPLSYGQPDATELALTDINLFLGRLRSDRFPLPLSGSRVEEALRALQKTMKTRGEERSLESIAQGFFEIANENMAQAIRKVSVARGYDVRDHVLVVFGGAGGQHACAIARRLQMKTVLLHPYAGVLSAFGMGLADVTWHGVREAGRLALDEVTFEHLDERFLALERIGREALTSEGFEPDQIRIVRKVDLRYRGTETSLTVHRGDDLPGAFAAEHERRFGYVRDGHPIELVNVRIDAVGRFAGGHPSADRRGPRPSPDDTAVGRLFLPDAGWTDVPVVYAEALPPHTHREGPLLVLEPTGTIVVEPGWELRVRDTGEIVLTDIGGSRRPAAVSSSVDPVQLEIFNNLYMSIAEQMGVVLRRTAISTNIRERLDFSCAVFDGDGGLVANAPHIPVHLGAMGESVRAVRRAHPDPAPGDVFVTNDPSCGGSHLPDVTVVTPVFDGTNALTFFTASRGHHEDIGGTTPGSMPPASRTLEEEGVVFSAERLVERGRFQEARMMQRLTAGPYPARDPRTNLADLEAQVAANRTGARLLGEMVERYGLDVVQAYMTHVQHNARAKVEDALRARPDGVERFEDAMDDGTKLVVTLTKRGDRLTVDFSGTDPEADHNLNAPPAVAVAAVLYVLRGLVGEAIPLNGGCLEPVEIIIPPGSLLSPSRGRAVCGGNVETSQRVVDILLGALGRAAASQGTMNNITFGNDSFGYYETICGGAGATSIHAGADAVHTHMTNTRITDPEVLEARFPIRLVEFAVRRGSGGAGRHRGGDGVVREIEALAPLSVSLLTQRRERAPFGLRGGGAGQPGRNLVNGVAVGGRTSFEVAPGYRIRLETPGGGGFGPP